MRIVFFGTPEFAVPSLDAVHREHDIVLVVAQPDRPAGRGMKMHVPAVIARARELGLSIAQPLKVREVLDAVAALKPDAGVVVAYGKILPAALLEIPRLGFFNVHGSILPKYRGAAPIQRAIENGETETGVTIMRVDEQLDHGPMLLIEKTAIDPDEHTPAVAQRLSHIGANALARVLRELPPETPQDHAQATIAPKIDKAEGEVTFKESARVIYDKFRAFDPWPGIFYKDVKLTDVVCGAAPASGAGTRDDSAAEAAAAPQSIVSIDDDGIIIACAEGALRIREMQRPGKPRTPAGAVARGLGWRVGDVL
ncbi:MAG: methionyl-tRNA formyltransferase [Acidobacteria bacterium]|nr:MAG: methionyl-tRNA formyltransferase [Acidobacteriota bacterium]